MTPEILKISAINCFSSNEMIVDPGKFKSIIFIFFLQNYYHSSYETLLHKSRKTTVNVQNLRNLCKEIFKSLNNLNPVFLKEFFYFKESNCPVREKCKLNLQIPKTNQVRFGTKIFRGLGPKIWNTLPYHIKTSENIEIFKKTIKNWNGVECKCLVCQKSI